jgi:threonine/homoserine/homoserine lactone efflux protein
MVSLGSLGAFALTALALIAVPGPSVLFVVSRGVALGRRAALLTVAGNAAGAYVQVLLVAAGLGALVERSLVLYTAIKLLGAAYLVFLGVQAIRHRRTLAVAARISGDPRPARRLLAEGFVVGVSNPKVIVFVAAVVTQFVDPHGAPVPVQMALLGLVFVAVALVSDGAWGLLAGSARTWLARSPRRLEALGGAGGVVTIGIGLRMAVSGRPD